MLQEAINCLEKGDLKTLFNMENLNINEIINAIRKSDRKKQIIDGFLDEMKKIFPNFCYDIIYDMEEYKSVTREILKKRDSVLPLRYLIKLLSNSSLGIEYFSDNLEEILMKYSGDIETILDSISDDMKKFVALKKLLLNSKNLKVRYIIISYLLDKKMKIDFDVTKYLILDNTYMPEKYVSEIAYKALMNRDKKLFNTLKDFIFKHYKTNTLGEHLLRVLLDYKSFSFAKNKIGIKEFEKNIDEYFKTASTWRVHIYENYARRISKDLLKSFERNLLYFMKNGAFDEKLEHIDIYGLTRLLEKYVSKYLDMSRNKTCYFIGEGSTTSCYRIGEYAFKLVQKKWSTETLICPDLYLILPNLEEKYLRAEDGFVKAGIEVQEYLEQSAKDVPRYIFESFREELGRLGYYLNDTLINGSCGDNTRLLNNLGGIKEEVPTWFEEYPVVLIDHDCIYKLEQRKGQKIY